MVELLILPAIVMGALIGLVELFFVHSDEAAMGMTWISHGLHALPFTILFVFLSMNVSFVLGLVNIGASPIIELVVRAVVALIAMVKIAGVAAISPGMRGVGQKLPHTLIIGALIFAAPYAWDYALVGIIGPYLPF